MIKETYDRLMRQADALEDEGYHNAAKTKRSEADAYHEQYVADGKHS